MCTSCSCVHMGVTSLVTVIAAVSLRRLLPSYCLILFLFWVTSYDVNKGRVPKEWKFKMNKSVVGGNMYNPSPIPHPKPINI